jgi:hypothetical protein
MIPIIAGAAILGGAAWYFWPVDHSQQSNGMLPPLSLSKKLFAQCGMVVQAKFDGEGNIYAIQLDAIPAPSGGGFGQFYGIPGAPISWDFFTQPIYRCKFINYTNDALFKVSVELHMIFSQSIKDDPPIKDDPSSTSLHSGQVTIDRGWKIEIPKIDSGIDASFNLYLFNMTSQFVYITLPTMATLSDGTLINLIQPTGNEMSFSPNQGRRA